MPNKKKKGCAKLFLKANLPTDSFGWKYGCLSAKHFLHIILVFVPLTLQQ